MLAKGAETRAGILVIASRTGDVPHWLRITGVIAELYDVVALALGFRTEEVQRMITVGPSGARGRRGLSPDLRSLDPRWNERLSAQRGRDL